ncbi:protein kinase [Clostridium thermarum]|uniref:protein kinase n=1 Tax=Clostridium thermarum TaxID=1716543 RepID=UPI0013D18470|nr:protein kinase [Clostridium thermarum]
MSKDKNIYDRYIKNFDIDLLKCKCLGKGNNGVVYLLPEGKIIKICYEVESCRKEYNILKRIHDNKYFPRVYGMIGNYMIRDYVDGVPLHKYIKTNGFTRRLAINIIELLEEFKKLKFTKQDVRCKDIMVKTDESLMVIDPKKFYTKKRNFPSHLSKGLYKLGVLDDFMWILKEEKPKLYEKWHKDIEKYIKDTFPSEF